MTSISLSTATSSHSRTTRPLTRDGRAPVEVAHDLVRVEPVGDMVDRDPAAEVRVTAVMAGVAFVALHREWPPAEPARTRAAGAEQGTPPAIKRRRVSSGTPRIVAYLTFRCEVSEPGARDCRRRPSRRTSRGRPRPARSAAVVTGATPMLAVTRALDAVEDEPLPGDQRGQVVADEDRLRGVAVREQDGELVAAEPREHVVATQPPADRVGGPAQQLVARVWPWASLMSLKPSRSITSSDASPARARARCRTRAG